MIFGVMVGKTFPNINALLSSFEISNISLIMAVLMWVMIYPMMIKVDFLTLKNAIKTPCILTWIVNWRILPFYDVFDCVAVFSHNF